MNTIKIDFQNFGIPTSINQSNIKIVDVREVFADLIYTNINGIKAHSLALKIYNSEGIIEFSQEEVKTIQEIAFKLCTPNFIDGLSNQISKNK